jgi:hypothetical protein
MSIHIIFINILIFDYWLPGRTFVGLDITTTAKALRRNQEIWLGRRKIHYLDHLLSDAQLTGGEQSCILCTQTGRPNKYAKLIVYKVRWNSHPKRVAWRSFLPRNCEGKNSENKAHWKRNRATFVPWPDIQSKWNAIGKSGKQSYS